jgi:hypothetical protein
LVVTIFGLERVDREKEADLDEEGEGVRGGEERARG